MSLLPIAPFFVLLTLRLASISALKFEAIKKRKNSKTGGHGGGRHNWPRSISFHTTPSKAWNGHAPRARGRKDFDRSCGSTMWSQPCAAGRATTLPPPAVSYDYRRTEPNAKPGFQSESAGVWD